MLSVTRASARPGFSSPVAMPPGASTPDLVGELRSAPHVHRPVHVGTPGVQQLDDRLLGPGVAVGGFVIKC